MHWRHSHCSCDSRKRTDAHGSAMFMFPIDEKAHSCSQIGDIHSPHLANGHMFRSAMECMSNGHQCEYHVCNLQVLHSCCTAMSAHYAPSAILGTLQLDSCHPAGESPAMEDPLFKPQQSPQSFLTGMSSTLCGLRTSMLTLIATSAPQAEVS